ncbi:hypothetical protein GCM10025867_33220 [Frondihabitans sucicola]|uniref:Uncharacterized protein n=1 Tax=Frondihabitans sucicola TaxID=1268041 RepID=A0ABM8GRK0_9MICO|nr:hypothetical protein GCM10025867_33220 [Frondihabitans sucicola]
MPVWVVVVPEEEHPAATRAVTSATEAAARIRAGRMGWADLSGPLRQTRFVIEARRRTEGNRVIGDHGVLGDPCRW